MRDSSEFPAAARSLYPACAFMDDHFADPIDVGQLARHASFSRYHFIRLFRRIFHETPYQYLTRKRIEKAKELLATTGLSVTEICFAVGFESLGSFSALFHRAVGWAPSVYRARVLEQRRTPLKFIPHCYVVMHGIRPVPQMSNFR